MFAWTNFCHGFVPIGVGYLIDLNYNIKGALA
jgi:hypothetical protein